MPATTVPSSATLLRVVAAISGVYDLMVAAALLLSRDAIAAWMNVPPPTPPIHVDLNGLFAAAVGIGYILPYRNPDRYRGYLWVMGPGLKGAGAFVFLADHLFRRSPAAFLLFAVSDGALALLTLVALLKVRPDAGRA